MRIRMGCWSKLLFLRLLAALLGEKLLEAGERFEVRRAFDRLNGDILHLRIRLLGLLREFENLRALVFGEVLLARERITVFLAITLALLGFGGASLANFCLVFLLLLGP